MKNRKISSLDPFFDATEGGAKSVVKLERSVAVVDTQAKRIGPRQTEDDEPAESGPAPASEPVPNKVAY